MDEQEFAEHLLLYEGASHELKIFMGGIVQYFQEHPDLQRRQPPVVHSAKSRLKEKSHLAAKLARKRRIGEEVASSDLFRKITDLAGVRLLHLFQEDFEHIDRVIRKKVADKDWFLNEKPKAYTWDPENVQYFRRFELEVQEKQTSYTSVHYVIRPREDSPVCCELQVRTLFEEIWGEVDHQINYPTPTTSVACREQIKVLSKIVGAGSRLLDSLKRVHNCE